MILTQALSAVQLSVEFVTGFFYLFVFSIFSSIIFFLPLKLSSLFRLINWYPLFSNVNSISSDLFFIQTIIVQRFCSWTSRVIRIKCSLLYMFFSAILEEDRQVPQSSHLFYSHRTTSSFLLAISGKFYLPFTPWNSHQMYLYLHNSLTHQYMFTILLPLIMGSNLIISALYRGSLIQHGTAWTV